MTEKQSEGSTSLFFQPIKGIITVTSTLWMRKLIKQILSTRSGIQCQGQRCSQQKYPNIYIAFLPRIKWSQVELGKAFLCSAQENTVGTKSQNCAKSRLSQRYAKTSSKTTSPRFVLLIFGHNLMRNFLLNLVLLALYKDLHIKHPFLITTQDIHRVPVKLAFHLSTSMLKRITIS